MKDEKHKLSKRNGDASYQDLINKGFLNEAILNYIALLGWSPEGEQEIFSLDELIEAFDVKRISKSGAIFDMNKLKWINSQYIKKLDTKQLTELCLPFLQEAYDLSDKSEAWIEKLVEVHRDHISCGEEIVEQVKLFFEDEIHLEDKLEQQSDLIEQTVDNIYIQELLQKLKEQEEALEPKYAELMGALIEKITGVLCEDKKDVIVYLIHQALNQLEKTKSVTLRVSKPDMLTVSAQKEQLRSCVSGEVDFDITEDDSLQENQCIIETDQRIIDCSLDVQLQNLKDQIRMLTIM